MNIDLNERGEPLHFIFLLLHSLLLRDQSLSESCTGQAWSGGTHQAMLVYLFRLDRTGCAEVPSSLFLFCAPVDFDISSGLPPAPSKLEGSLISWFEVSIGLHILEFKSDEAQKFPSSLPLCGRSCQPGAKFAYDIRYTS